MYFFEYIGAFFYWIFLALLDWIRGKEIYSLSDIAKGRDQYDPGDQFNFQCYMVKLKVIGFVALGAVLLLLKEI
ncbi:hypothetical protein BD749_1684 [Pontibacter ramchanderi]|uniref:Uncharacterized protein n=1 Tax=Pontibacter ramchanderi TaxID=1179743 RepID=A0A2N3UB43_9BACT|nr:hypothetical protein BD749_1684 [Pontibacter ramchanderi]